MMRCQIVFLAIALISSGCSTTRDDRLAIDGKVSLDGRPIDQATLVLIPQSTANAVVTARVDTGHFSFTPETGPLPGRYAARINTEPASIEDITAVARTDPRQAAREFNAKRGSAGHAAKIARCLIEITKNASLPLEIDLKTTRQN